MVLEHVDLLLGDAGQGVEVEAELAELHHDSALAPAGRRGLPLQVLQLLLHNGGGATDPVTHLKIRAANYLFSLHEMVQVNYCNFMFGIVKLRFWSFIA